MIPTIFGYLIIVAALVLMPTTITRMLGLVLVSSLLGAASAVSLPSLGGANITPASLALLFLVVRILLCPAGQFSIIAKAFQQNVFLAFFCIYGAVTAFLLPRLFFHVINVPQLRATGGGLFSTAPLEFSSQNITTAIYLIGTFLAFLSATIASGVERKNRAILSTIIFISWAHIGFGILDIFLSKIGLRDGLDFFRNGSYLQLVQDIGGVQRVAGIFPEASAYAGYGFSFLVVNTELWMRNERPKLTGTTALAMLIMLLLTTSSTAYVSIAFYALILLARLLFTPMQLPLAKKINLGGIAFAAGTILLILEVFMPAMSALMFDILQQMTFGKLHSVSGVQRTFWAQKGWEAFWKSGWIGVGAGSLRSSGLISAVAGSLGALGLVALAGSAWRVLEPLRLQTHTVSLAGDARVRISFAWAAVIGLVPAFLSAPSPDPGLLFGIFSGIAASNFLDSSKTKQRHLQVNEHPFPLTSIRLDDLSMTRTA
jgi:hypothetical protein